MSFSEKNTTFGARKESIDEVRLSMMFEDLIDEDNFFDVLDVLQREESMIRGSEIDIVILLAPKLKAKSTRDRKKLIKFAAKKLPSQKKLWQLLSFEELDHERIERKTRKQITRLLRSSEYSPILYDRFGIEISKINKN